MNRKGLIEQLYEYEAYNEVESQMHKKMLLFIQNNENCFRRELLSGHITGSCWVVNEDFSKVLLIHHAKLDKWLQPGGHCDGNENVFEVAKKELKEETGLNINHASTEIFDVDIHSIPRRKEIPEHEHFDIRYLFIVDDNQRLIRNHETNDLKWITLDQIEAYNDESSVLRMRDKLLNRSKK